MSSIIQDSYNQGPQSAVHTSLAASPLGTSHVQAGNLNLQAHSLTTQHRSIRTQIVTPQSQPFNALAPGTSHTEFKLNMDSIKLLTYQVELDFVDANTSSSLTVEKVLDMIDYIELRANDGGIVVQRIDSIHLLNAMSELGREQYIAISRALTASSAAYTTSSTNRVNVWIPLFKNAWDSPAEVWASGFSSPLSIRTYWKGGCRLHTEGIKLSNVQLVAQTYEYDAAIRQAALNRYANSRLDFRFSSTAIAPISETITYNAPRTLMLTSLQGLITSITVACRVGGVFTRIQKMELQTPQGVNMSGGTTLDFDYVNTIMRASEGKYTPNGNDPTDSSQLFFPYYIGFDEEAHSNAHGGLNGYIPMRGQHKLVVTVPPPSSWQSGDPLTVAAEIIVLYEFVSVFSCNRRLASVAYS